MTDLGTPSDKANEVSFLGTGGTFLMHHAKTVHWASGNKSKNRTRKALGFIYYARRARLDIAAQNAYQVALDTRLKIAEQI